MSYILEALRKAERERQRAETLTVAEVLSVPPAKRRNWLPWVMVALLLALNGGLVWYVWPGGKENAKPPEPAQAAETSAKPRHEPQAGAEKQIHATAKNREPMSSSPVSPSNPAPIADVSRPSQVLKPTVKASPSWPRPAKPAVAAREIAPPPANSPERANSSPLKDRAIRRLSDEEAREGAHVIREEHPETSPPTDSIAARVPFAEPGSEDEEHELKSRVPSISEMPQEIQQNLPNLKINVLAYSSTRDERFAVINMVKYNRGEQLPGGAVLKEIEPGGVILELNGKRFLVPHR